MEEQFDVEAIMVRAGEIAKAVRKSDVYPALIGGIAGGIAGALTAAIIVGRVSSRSAEPLSHAAKEARSGWSLREAVQLLTVVASLAKQAQAWYKERGRK
jgi:hypothetical protein